MRSAEDFLAKYARDALHGPVDRDAVRPGVQPAVGSESRCLADFRSLGVRERLRVIDKLDASLDTSFFAAAYRISSIRDAKGRVAALIERARAVRDGGEAAMLRLDATEEGKAQRAALSQLRERMSAGLYVSEGDRTDYDELTVKWRELHRIAPYLFDSDEDGFQDARFAGEAGVVDAFPADEAFNADGDGDGVPDALDAAPEDAAVFFDPAGLGSLRRGDAFDISVEGTGKSEVITISVRILLKPAGRAAYEGDLNALARRFSREVPAFFDKAMADEFKGRVRIRPTFTTDANEPHHAEVGIQDCRKGDADAVDWVLGWRHDIETHTVAHEIGHMLGWLDKYHKPPSESHGLDYDSTFAPGLLASAVSKDLMGIDTVDVHIAASDVKTTIAFASSRYHRFAAHMLYKSRVMELMDIELEHFAELRAQEGRTRIDRALDIVGNRGAIANALPNANGDEREAWGKRIIERRLALIGRRSRAHALDLARRVSTREAVGSLGATIAKLKSIRGSIPADERSFVDEEIGRCQRTIEEIREGGADDLSSAKIAIAKQELVREYRERFTDKPRLDIHNVKVVEKEGRLPHLRFNCTSAPSNGGDEVDFIFDAPPPASYESPQEYAKKLFKLSRAAHEEALRPKPYRLKLSLGAGMWESKRVGELGLAVDVRLHLQFYPGLAINLWGDGDAGAVDVMPYAAVPIYGGLEMRVGAGPSARFDGGHIGLFGRFDLSYDVASRGSLCLFVSGYHWSRGRFVPNERHDLPEDHPAYSADPFKEDRDDLLYGLSFGWQL